MRSETLSPAVVPDAPAAHRGGVTGRWRRGATLPGSLVVVALGVLTVGVMLPAAHAIRDAEKRTVSMAQLLAIAAACDSYHMAFGADPGITPDSLWNDSWRAPWSETEAMTVSLMGGMAPEDQITPKSNIYRLPEMYAASLPPKWAIDVGHLGGGPRTTDGKSYGAFYFPKPAELGPIAGTYFGENTMPDLLDASTGVPLLYFRIASRGSSPVSYTGKDGGNTSLEQNTCFTNGQFTIGGQTFDEKNHSLLGFWGSGQHLENGPDNLAWLVAPGGAPVVKNAVNHAGVKTPGGYLLLSPGPDGVYLSNKQLKGNRITSFNDLAKFDDVYLRGEN